MPSPTAETPDILAKIIRRIREDEPGLFEKFAAAAFRPAERTRPRDILAVLGGGFAVIAEIKKGSPSRGRIRDIADPAALARDYEAGGAAAVSVVTEKNFFLGDKADLGRVRDAVSLPILRKDFIFHPAQVHESFDLGADFILLIASILHKDDLASLLEICRGLGMEALVEVHGAEDLERALGAGARLIGINNRDLRDFSVDWTHALRLRKGVPPGIPVIAESGIRSPDQVRTLRDRGFAGVLVGEHLLRQKNPGQALRELLHG